MSVLENIKRAARAGFRHVAQLYQALRRCEYRYVFILGHMRSGSTVLAHIFSSHSNFVGAGETHTDYKTPADLPKLIIKTCELLRKIDLGSATYIVDQINHPYLTDEVLSSPSIHKCVILIRAPEASLKSLMALFGWNEATAIDCYISRLIQITRYGHILRERAMLVEYDDLVEQTDKILGSLSQFFSIDPAFANSYRKSRFTRKIGDPSKNILSGRIIRTQSHEKNISSRALTEAVMAFDKCRQELFAAGVASASAELSNGFLRGDVSL